MNGRKAMKRKEIYAGGLKSARESRLGKLAAARAASSSSGEEKPDSPYYWAAAAGRGIRRRVVPIFRR